MAKVILTNLWFWIISALFEQQSSFLLVQPPTACWTIKPFGFEHHFDPLVIVELMASVSFTSGTGRRHYIELVALGSPRFRDGPTPRLESALIALIILIKSQQGLIAN